MPFGLRNQLEKDFAAPYSAWKKTPGAETTAAMLTALQPVIDGAIRTHVGAPNDLLRGRAKLLTLDGLKTYDPNRGRLQTHLYNHLQGLKRINRQQTQIMRVPERIALERYHLQSAQEELTASLGREPTDLEVSERLNLSPARIARVRSWHPGVAEGMVQATPDDEGQPAVMRDRSALWAEIVYDELDDYHRKIMEFSFGLNGRQALSNQAIAAKLGRSPGAISQAKARIQQKLDEQYDLEGAL
jgi:DNA-directed RNA polymerase specialized sigma subunit